MRGAVHTGSLQPIHCFFLEKKENQIVTKKKNNCVIKQNIVKDEEACIF